MKTITFKPNNVCSQEMTLEVDNGVVIHASVVRGCQGNLQGICRLIEGMKVEDVIDLIIKYSIIVLLIPNRVIENVITR